MPVNQPIIEVKNLNFAYGDIKVLEDVSFSIQEGDYVGIVGPNGGGKTTLLKILVGLLAPQSGTVKIFGEPVQNMNSRSKIGYVPQRIAQNNDPFPATVYELVESGRIPAKKPFQRITSQDKAVIQKALDIAQISVLQNKLVSNLSGGQKQRVYVARALAAESKILVLDEPFVGIDINAQRDFYAFLKNLNESQGLTIIFVSHDVDVISEEVKSILCLNRGLLCFGSPEMLHKEGMIETLYGKEVTHIHHSTHDHA